METTEEREIWFKTRKGRIIAIPLKACIKTKNWSGRAILKAMTSTGEVVSKMISPTDFRKLQCPEVHV